MSALDELVDALDQPHPALARPLLLLSAALTERPDAVEVGDAILNELVAAVSEPTIPALVHQLFDVENFHGDVGDYHAPENSFLDRVLERRVGMPITLSAIVAEVGSRFDLGLHLIGLPGHVLVGTKDDPGRFIDAFAGVELDGFGVRQRFASIFGPDAQLPPNALQPLRPAEVVTRVCNNLMRTWSERDPAALNRLLDVRASLPASPREAEMLIALAEGRGRFDVAARVRESVDPDDPEIGQLWARLN